MTTSITPSEIMFEKHIVGCFVSKPKEDEMNKDVEEPNVSSGSKPFLSLNQTQSKTQESNIDPSKTACSACSKIIGTKFLSRHLIFHHSLGDFK